MTQEAIRTEIVEAMNTGKFFTVEFVKKDGTLRKMLARMGVTKHHRTDGTPSTTAHIEKYVTVYDIQAEGYRNINLETIVSFKCGEVQV